jgi:zinc protease
MRGAISTIVLLLFVGMLLTSCQTTHGIKTVQLPVKSDPTVSFRLWVKVGSQNDPKGKEGLAVLTAQLIAEGSTEKNSYEQILEKLYPMAAGYGAQVDKEMTVFTGRVHRDYLDEYAELFLDAILHPAFKAEDFERVKSQQLNYLERTLRYADDEEFGKEALSQFIFAGTPYEHPEEGYIESVKSITLEDVKEFYRKYYTRDNIVLGIGGGYSGGFLSRFTKQLATLPPGAVEPPPKPEPAPINGLEVLLIEKNTGSTAISFGYPIDLVRSNSKEFYAMWLANSWLGEHRNSSSHLYQVIREARGLNYGDYSYIEHFPNGGRRQFPPPNVARRQQIFQVWIRPVLNEHRHFALRAAIRELDKLARNGLTQDQFELTRSFLKTYYLHYAPTTSGRLGYMLDDLFYGMKPGFLEQFPKMMDELTLDDVNAAIRKYIQTKNMKIVMITKDAASLKNQLVLNTVSPIKYRTPKPPEVLEEDKEIIRYPLDVKPENVIIKKADEMFLGPFKR